MKKITLLLLAILTTHFISAQKNGIITGKVVDAKTGEDMIAVAVVIKGNKTGTATDLDGTFKLSAAPGKYDLQFTCISYDTLIVEGVEVKEGQINEPLQVALKDRAITWDKGFTKTEKAVGTTALINEQRTGPILFSAISDVQMRRTGDRTAAEVVRRISGATVQDNFVIIRGLPDRYNAAYLNGSPLPSSEPDRKAFSFDIFPSALLNDIKVIKTAMPSVSGEFAGGLINVRTKDIPEKNYYQFSLGASFDLMTTFGNFTMSRGGNTDFFGIDDGTRGLPSSFPTSEKLVGDQNAFLKDSLVGYAQKLQNNYTTNHKMAAPGTSFQFSMGHNINLIKKEKRAITTDKMELGSVAALTYTSRLTYREIERNDYDQSGQILHYDDKQYNVNTSWGALWNIAFLYSKKNGANNRISFKNLFNVNTNDQYLYREGQDLANGSDIRSYNMMYTQNTIFSTQLNGEHVLPASKIRFDWSAGYSRLNRIVPDNRITEYRRVLGDTTQLYSVPFSNGVQLDKAGRFYSTQLDNTYSGSFDLSLPFKIGPSRHELKMGTFLMHKDREFSARQLGYVKYKSAGADVSTISTYSIDSIFDIRNMGPEGLMIKEATRNSDTYHSSQSLIAAFVQIENALFENKLKFVWGARLESFRQQLNTFDYATGAPITVDTNIVDILPSLNVVYAVRPDMNLRLSASQTVCRPESRELAPFTFYDYGIYAYSSGNPKLQRTKITNVDLRYEWYPSGGQMISVTGFFKYFENPIEKVLYPSGSTRLFTYFNVPAAYAAGAEIEYSFTIGSFLNKQKKHARLLDDLSLSGNFAYIYSEVDLGGVAGVNSKRALQGQSPYIINTTFSYNDSKYNFGVNLAMNYVGPRIWTVGNTDYGSIMENPRFIMDLQFSKTFLKNKNLELRLNFSDLLAQTAFYYQEANANGIYDDGVDSKIIARRMSQQISFSLGYKF
jgi:outer membrane receptor protein involved in Fe transport